MMTQIKRLSCCLGGVLWMSVSGLAWASGQTQHGGHGHHGAQPGQGAEVAEVVEPPAQVSVEQCWIRALPGNLPAAAYFTVVNQGTQSVSLVDIQAEGFEHAMLHATRTENGMARMVHAGAIPVPAGGQFAFNTDNGFHAMLEGPKQALQVGGAQWLSFRFDRGGPLRVSCVIQPPDTLG